VTHAKTRPLACHKQWELDIKARLEKRSFEQTNKRSECASFVKAIASIEDPAVIQKILAHLDGNATSAATALLPDCRASPTVGLLV
jgi:hypothetical protein